MLPQSEHAREPLVRVSHLTKTYGTGNAEVRVLQGLELEVAAGEMLAIIGASGSGKTTLMNILGLLDRPSAGQYALDGANVARLSDDKLSALRNRAIGFVFQSFQLVPELTVVENVELPGFYMRLSRAERRRRSSALLDSVGLSHRLRHRPSQLSGGESQRVAIARALLVGPRLLLADEPTGNLDTRSGDDVLQLFDGLHAQGHTILMVTHNSEIADRLPRVVEMRDGRIVSDHCKAAQA